MNNFPYIMILVALIIFAILFAGHWLLYKTVVRFLNLSNQRLLLILKIAVVLLSLSFVLASFAVFRYDNLAVRVFYTAAAAWVGIFFLLFLGSLALWLIFGAAKIFFLALNYRLVAEIIFGFALAISVYSIINANNIRVISLEVSLPNLPSQWRGKTAVWASDLHLGAVQNDGFAKRVAALIQSKSPDIVFLGGDIYDGVAADPNRLAEPFAQIQAPLGKYFITGNHEEFSDNTKYLDAMRTAGVNVLYNELTEVDGLQILGVAFRDTVSEENFKTILGKMNLDRSRPSILLEHSPVHIATAQAAGISLQLSGHAHRGQFFPFGFITSLVYHGYDYGLKKTGNLTVFTSAGAGTWGPPLRLGASPDIVILRFW